MWNISNSHTNNIFAFKTETMTRYQVVLKPLGVFVISWVGLLFIQWCIIKLYITICMDTSLWGILTNAASMGSPLCHFINSVHYEIIKNYIMLWGTAATITTTWIMAKLQV